VSQRLAARQGELDLGWSLPGRPCEVRAVADHVAVNTWRDKHPGEQIPPHTITASRPIPDDLQGSPYQDRQG
jgi:hypothetical protein